MNEPIPSQVPVAPSTAPSTAHDPPFRPFTSFAVAGVAGGLLAIAVTACLSEWVRRRLAHGDVTVLGGELLFYLGLGVIVGFLWPAWRGTFVSAGFCCRRGRRYDQAINLTACGHPATIRACPDGALILHYIRVSPRAATQQPSGLAPMER